MEGEGKVEDLGEAVQHEEEEAAAASMLSLGDEAERSSKEDLAEYVNLTGRMDAETVLQVSAARMTAATPWEVLLCRARCMALEDEVGLLDLLLSDVNVVLSELRALITASARPPKPGGSRKYRNAGSDDSVVLDECMSLALGLAKGEWRAKDPDEVRYYHSMVSPDMLFNRKSQEDIVIRPEDIKQESLTEIATKKPERRGRKRKQKQTDEETKVMETEDKVESEQVRPKRQRRLPKKLRDGKQVEKEVAEDKPEEAGPQKSVEEKKVAVSAEKKSLVERKKDPNSQGKYYLCLKCGQKLCKAYGKQHEARCTGFFVRHPEYKKASRVRNISDLNILQH